MAIAKKAKARKRIFDLLNFVDIAGDDCFDRTDCRILNDFVLAIRAIKY